MSSPFKNQKAVRGKPKTGPKSKKQKMTLTETDTGSVPENTLETTLSSSDPSQSQSNLQISTSEVTNAIQQSNSNISEPGPSQVLADDESYSSQSKSVPITSTPDKKNLALNTSDDFDLTFLSSEMDEPLNILISP